MAAAAMAGGLMTAVPAYASCAAPAPASASQFTGLVLSTSRSGRDAQVRILTGTVVEVIGSPASDGQFTSVDRAYQVGTWYVFDPNNASSPFHDNLCTATHALPAGWTPPRQTATATSARQTAAATPILPVGGSATWLWAVGGAAAVLALLGAFRFARASRRRR